MLTGDHLKTPPSKVAPSGDDSGVMVTSSPSGSNALTARMFSMPTVALNTASTVTFGLALAAIFKINTEQMILVIGY